MVHPPAAREFRGSARFEVRSRIGEGAVGIVYDAFDRERGARVALKTLRTTNPQTLLLLKKEFRAVQDLRHPNLVHVGELFEEEGTWFFTMEFVQGTPFIQYVRPLDRKTSSAPPPSTVIVPGVAAIGSDKARRYRSSAPERPARAREGSAAATTVDEGRLRASLTQLVRGLCALHDANKIHRDIKPSNVLVSDEGRVVILDFGVAGELVRDQTGEQGVLGTLGYMAPEQALGEKVGPAADWYAVGVVLYQSLTGQLPFHGETHEVLANKLLAEPPPPSSIQRGGPRDLEALCHDLLRPSPDARPSGREILDRLGCRISAEEIAYSKHAPVFVGRHRERDLLSHAFEEVKRGSTVTVFIHGESGVGKSFLVRQFLEELGDREKTALAFAGRCYERESVPYKAVDGVVDQLSRHLRSLSNSEIEALLPADSARLALAFPVLAEIAAPPSRRGTAALPESIENPTELRAHVFSAMRALLARIAVQRPLVVAIDDMQWADVDSLALLADVMRPPGAPPMLLVATIRMATERLKRGAIEQMAALQITGDVRHVHLDHLLRDEARTLAARLLGDARADGEVLDAIVEEAHGHPLFIDELVRQRAWSSAVRPLKLDDALWVRVARLDPSARRLLELLSVAGLPIAQEIAAHANAIDLGQLFELASELRAANFVKTGGSRKEDAIEPYHDRVRESVLAHLDPADRAHCHGRLAATLERFGSSDAEALATHWEAAGNAERAAGYAERAADDAMHALAFERAARLYRLTLSLRREGAEGVRDLERRLAEALTNAGYVAQAAEVYLGLAKGADREAALDLRRRAAEQLLCSGRFAGGLEILRAVLGAVGVYFPKSPLAVIVSVLVARLVLWARGLAFRERDASRADARALVRIDALWSAGAGFSMTDNIRGAYFQTRNLLLALRLGDIHRIMRALGMEVCFRSAGGAATRARTRNLLATAWELAARVGTPEALAMANTAAGYAHFMVAEWRDAKRFYVAAEELFRDRCIGVAFQLNTTRLMLYSTLAFLGEMDELASRVPAALREVEQKGDRYSIVHLEMWPMLLLALAADEPERARRAHDAASAQLVRGAFLVQHYLALAGRCKIDLYEGDAGTAYDRMVHAWPALERSLLLRVQVIRIEMLDLRCRCAIAAVASRPKDRDALLRVAERDARRLSREGLPWAEAYAAVGRGAIAAERARLDEARTRLADAARMLDDLGMKVHASAARRRHGEIVGGESGDAIVREADSVLSACSIRDPERLTATLVPPLPPR